MTTKLEERPDPETVNDCSALLDPEHEVNVDNVPLVETEVKVKTEATSK